MKPSLWYRGPFVWLAVWTAAAGGQRPDAKARAETLAALRAAVLRGTPRLAGTLAGHEGRVTCVAFSADGRWLASGDAGGSVKVWDAATGRCIHTLRGHAGGAVALAFFSEDDWLLTADATGAMRTWNVATGKCGQTRAGGAEAGRLVACAFAADARRAVTAHGDGTLAVWGWSGLDRLRTRRHEGVSAVAVTPSGARAVSAGDRLILWDAERGVPIRTFGEGRERIAAVAVSPDGRWVASGGAQVALWNAETGQRVRVLPGRSAAGHAVAFSPDGKRLASGGADGAVRMWDATTGEPLPSLRSHSKPITVIAFAQGGQRLVSGGADGAVNVWTLGPLDPLELHRRNQRCAAAIKAALRRTKVTHYFFDTPMGDVLRALRHYADVPVIGFEHPVPVGGGRGSEDANTLTLAVDDLPMKETLDRICGRTGIVHAVLDGALVIATPGQMKRLTRADTMLRQTQLPPHTDRAAVASMVCGTVSLDVAGASVSDVLSRLRSSAGVPLALDLWPARDAYPTVTLKFRHMPLDRALRWLCRLTGLACIWHDGVVAITTPDTARGLVRQEGRPRRPEGPPSPRLDAQLARRVSFDFVETPLEDVVVFLNRHAPLPIVLDTEAIRDEASTITLKAKDMPLHRALRWICHLVRLQHAWQDGAVLITKPEFVDLADWQPGAVLAHGRTLASLQRPPNKRMATEMARPVSFDFVETPLQDVVAHVASLIEAPIILDVEAVRDEAPTVTLKMADMRCGAALRWICRLVRLVPIWRDGALFITKPERVAAALRQDEAGLLFLPPAKRRLGKLVARPISFDFIETPLTDVAAFLGRMAKIPVVLDCEGFDREPSMLTLEVEGMPFDAALRWVCRMTSAACAWVDGELVLTGAGRLAGVVERRRTAVRRAMAMGVLQRPPDEQLAARMKTKVRLTVAGEPLRKVCATLSEQTGLNIRLDEAAFKAGAPKLTLYAVRLPFGTVLSWVCRHTRTAHLWRERTLVITSRAAADDAARATRPWQQFATRPKLELAPHRAPRPAPAPPPPVPKPPTARLAAQMAQRISVGFAQTPLADVAPFLAEITGVPIALDPEALQDAAATITLDVDNQRLDHALWAICREAGLTYVWREGKALITTPARAPAPALAIPPGTE